MTSTSTDTQPDLFDMLGEPAPVGMDAPQTSAIAARRAPVASHRMRALAHIVGRGDRGATDDEMERLLNIKHSSLSSARNHLAAKGLIAVPVTDGERLRRPVKDTGNPADVWVATPTGREAFRAAVTS